MKSFLQALLPCCLAMFIVSSPCSFVNAEEAPEGFRTIFNGKDLADWDGNPKFWRVEDGAIVGQTTAENPTQGNTFLIWDKQDVADFELRLKFYIDGGNSGIQYRSERVTDAGKWVVGGYQADIDASGRYAGILYEEKGRGILAERGNKVLITETGEKKVIGTTGEKEKLDEALKKGEWNDYTIIARGNTIQHILNGQTTIALEDRQESKRSMKGLLALQLHAGPPMTIKFKDLFLQEMNQVAANDSKKKVVFVAGRPSHGYGSHEHKAGCLYLAKAIESAMPNFETVVYHNGWPKEGLKAFDGADAVVVYCDGGGGHLLNDHIEEFDQIMKRGVGLACLHYAVEVPKGRSGDAFVDWIGGYFETHWSVNPHWTAKFETYPEHPVATGVQPFEINDEWYFHMRFREDMQGVTPILSAVAPKDTMARRDGPHSGNPHVRASVARKDQQHVAWVAERPDGGRGFGFTGGHLHWNWGDDNFRKVVLNAIVWIAKGDVPEGGVSTETPSREALEANQDFAKPEPKKSASLQKRFETKLVATKSSEQDTSHRPENAVDNLDVHADLKAELFAAEPLLRSPAGIDVDHRGRVWVCEIVNYRSHRNKRPEGDRILILEDTNGDGVADKQKVFYQGRDIDSPHGICVLGNRVIVSANGQVISFFDDDGDDIPDRKEAMFTGISGAQHDHGIHAFVFGPDGKLYFNFGNEGHQLLDAQGQPVVDMAGNVVKTDRNPYQQGLVFRMNLDGSQFETLGWNFRNNWMVTVDSFGTIWQSDNDDDGNRGVRINYVMEFGNYGYRDEMTGAGWRTERTGMSTLPEQHWHQRDPGVVPNLLHTGAGSPTGITVYEGDLLPESFHGQLIHCDAGPSVTRAYPTFVEGAGYRAETINILEGTRDVWFRPSDVKIAPDGSLIVADWYDPGVGGHQMRDSDRGRIFRVLPKDHSGEYTAPKFDFQTADGAVAALQNPNFAVRYLAWTALHSMGQAAEAELLKLAGHANPRMRARALWLLGKIPSRGMHYVETAIEDESADIRILGLRLARQLDSVDQLQIVARLADDPSSAVRRECAIALRHQTSDHAAELWAQLAAQHDGNDRWYLEALGIAADQQWDKFIGYLNRENFDWKSPAGRDIVWRSRTGQSAVMLAKVIADNDGSPSDLLRYFRAFDFLPAEQVQPVLLRLIGLNSLAEEKKQLVVAESFRRLDPQRIASEPSAQQALNELLDAIRGSEDYIDTVVRFGVTDRFADLLSLAQSDPAGQLGVKAIRALLAAGGTEPIEKSLASIETENSLATIEALGNAGDQRAIEWLMPKVHDDQADLELRRSAVRGVAKIQQGAQQLVKLIEQEKLDSSLTSAAAAELTQSRFRDIRETAVRLFPLPPTKDAEPLPSIRELARQQGDSKRGQAVFAGIGTCSKCHIVNGSGKEVGPDLSEIGNKLSREAMFESILYPSAGISHNYEAWTLVSVDGNVVSGLLTSQTDDSVVITSDDGIAREFPRSSIEELAKQKISLMPADLQKLVSKQELVDVVTYLETLQKP